MAKEVKIIWFRGYHPIYDPSGSTQVPTYVDHDDTRETEEKLARYLNDGWTIATGGGGGDKGRFFVILVRG